MNIFLIVPHTTPSSLLTIHKETTSYTHLLLSFQPHIYLLSSSHKPILPHFSFFKLQQHHHISNFYRKPHSTWLVLSHHISLLHHVKLSLVQFSHRQISHHRRHQLLALTLHHLPLNPKNANSTFVPSPFIILVFFRRTPSFFRQTLYFWSCTILLPSIVISTHNLLRPHDYSLLVTE